MIWRSLRRLNRTVAVALLFLLTGGAAAHGDAPADSRQPLTAHPVVDRDPGPSGVHTVYAERSLLLKCSQFNVRAVESSSEAIATATISTGNLHHIRITGVAEGVVDVVVWSVADEDPLIFEIHVLPDPRTYGPLEDMINRTLGVQVKIEPIPSSDKIRISGTLKDYWQAQRVLTYVVSRQLTQERIVNEMYWPPPPCSPCCCSRRHRHH